MSSTRLETDGDGRLHAIVTTPPPLEPIGLTYAVVGNSMPSLEPGITFVGVDVGRPPTIEEQVVPRAGVVDRLERRSYSDDVRSRARELWAAGMSWQGIASAVGCSKSTVGMWVRR